MSLNGFKQRISYYYDSLVFDVNYETEKLISCNRENRFLVEHLNRNRRCLIDQIADAESYSLNELTAHMKCKHRRPIECYLTDQQLIKKFYQVRSDGGVVSLIECQPHTSPSHKNLSESTTVKIKSILKKSQPPAANITTWSSSTDLSTQQPRLTTPLEPYSPRRSVYVSYF